MQDSEEFLRAIFHILGNELNANVEESKLSNTFNGSYVDVRKFLNSPSPSQDPPVSSKAPNWDLEEMDVLYTFKIKTESQNLDHGYIKE